MCSLCITALSETFSTLSLPSNEDFHGASAALLRLQRTFALSTDDVAAGRILSEDAASPLAADDFQHIGRVALEVGKMTFFWFYQYSSIYTRITNTH